MRTFLHLAAIASLAALGACAPYVKMSAPPAMGPPVTLAVSRELPGALAYRLPIGSTRIGDSTVYLTGHQRGMGAVVALGFIPVLGILGAVAADAANDARGREMLQAVEPSLRIDVAARAEQLLAGQRSVAAGERLALLRQGRSKLLVTPMVFLEFVDETLLRPQVTLVLEETPPERTAFQDDRRDLWWNRYVAVAAEAKPLEGAGSWTDAGGAAFRQAVDEALGTAVDVMVRDLTGALHRETGREANVTVRHLLMTKDLTQKALVIEADARRIVFTPRVADTAHWSGVSVFPTSLVKVE